MTAPDDDPEERAWNSSISPHFRRSDLGPARPSDVQFIMVFADRVFGWQLDTADRLIKADEHAGFAVLSIVISYFEMIGKHIEGFEGEGESRKHFRIGFQSVFQHDFDPEQADSIADRLYSSVRNGLYHDAITSAAIVLRRDPSDMRIMYAIQGLDGETEIVINPEWLTNRIRDHFAAYVGELLLEPPGELRATFMRRVTWVDQAAGR